MAFTMNGAYFNGLDESGLQTALQQIPGSVTTDYILFSLNVPSSTSADISFGLTGPVLASGGTVTPATGDLLESVVNAGTASGKCQRVWLSIGGAGLNAFTNIQTILTNGGEVMTSLTANFLAIREALGSISGVQFVGFDLDYEEFGDLASVVTNVTLYLCDNLKDPPITFCPFTSLSAWIGALQQVYAAKGSQPVVGLNLQTYAGGAGNNPQQWVDAIVNTENTGVDDPAAFVWPIVSCDPNAPPASTAGQVTQNLKQWGSQGASLWATAALPFGGSDLSDYGNAIAAGLGPGADAGSAYGQARPQRRA